VGVTAVSQPPGKRNEKTKAMSFRLVKPPKLQNYTGPYTDESFTASRVDLAAAYGDHVTGGGPAA
jgi:hypothetical protein